MKQLLGIYLLAAIFVWVIPAGTASATSDRQGRPATASTTLKNSVPNHSEFSCSDSKAGKFCSCNGAADCIALKNSGKCIADIDVSADGKSGQCSSSGAGAVAGTNTTFGKAPPKGAGPSEFSCNYDLKGNQTDCSCAGAGDCLKLADSGHCNGPLTQYSKYPDTMVCK